MFTADPLEGLPTYGPRPLSFPKPDAFREGYVVQFTTDSGDTWVGNFATFDEKGLNTVRTDLGPRATVVVAGGAGYIVDVEAKKLVRDLGFGIAHIWFDGDLQAFVLSNGLWFETFNDHCSLWQSRRISWDGIRKLECQGRSVTGEAYDPTSEPGRWLPFNVNLETGKAEGGSFPADER